VAKYLQAVPEYVSGAACFGHMYEAKACLEIHSHHLHAHFAVYLAKIHLT